ncbi:MAG: methionyl-tRNA formyltransferase [Oscillospiraceae bacterium]|nr:methionyl-tRNA formyltransferase [Oscillospiraceae bacterium]
MNVIFMGTPDFAIPTLKALCDNGHNIMAVFTQTDKPKGRGMKLTPSPVKEFALAHDITVYQPNSLKKESEIYTPIIKELNPDVIVVVAYGKILPPEVLKIPKLGCINVHGSLLPKYRGSAPIQWTVLNGDEFGGVTTMLMAEGMDTGDMLLKESVKVGKNETSAELYERLSFVGAELLIKTLNAVAKGELTPIPQNEDEATLAPMLSKDLCPIDFAKTAKEVHSQICGLSDWPCATTTLEGKKLKVYRCEIVTGSKGNHAPGEIVNEKDFTVACGDGFVRFLEIQAEGSRRMETKAYLLGRPVKKGTCLC